MPPRPPIPGWLALAAIALAGGCGDGPAGGPDAGGPDAGGPVAQGEPPTSDLAINEVAPDAPDGAPDWIELVNRGDEALDLCGYFLTDLADRLDHYHPLGGVAPPEPCPARPLEPGGYLVVTADDGAGEGIDHAGFALAHGDEVHVVAIDGLVLDGLLYLVPDDVDGDALARIPDGEGPFYVVAPTPGAANPEAP